MYYTLSEIPDIYKDYFTIFYMGDVRYYQVYKTPQAFINFYLSVPKRSRHYYEVIRSTKRKFYVDIDKDISIDEILEFNELIRQYFYKFYKVMTHPTIFSSCNEYKTSYHIVVPDTSLTSDECINIVNWLDPFQKICDHSVYKHNQLFRIEGSTKYNQDRYKFILDEYDISDNLEKYFVSLTGLGYTHNKNKNKVFHKAIVNTHLSSFNLHDQFKIRKHVSETYILLTRKQPGFCPICKRIHDNENGYLYYTDKWNFGCFRAK